MPELSDRESFDSKDAEYLKDFPPSPLDLYRKQASFDWKAMMLTMEDERILKFKVCHVLYSEVIIQ